MNTNKLTVEGSAIQLTGENFHEWNNYIRDELASKELWRYVTGEAKHDFAANGKLKTTGELKIGY